MGLDRRAMRDEAALPLKSPCLTERSPSHSPPPLHAGSSSGVRFLEAYQNFFFFFFFTRRSQTLGLNAETLSSVGRWEEYVVLFLCETEKTGGRASLPFNSKYLRLLKFI